jgi:hypothetical protein
MSEEGVAVISAEESEAAAPSACDGALEVLVAEDDPTVDEVVVVDVYAGRYPNCIVGGG